MSVQSLDDETLAMLRDGDRDRYLTALVGPGRVRSDLLALYAFNLELARVRETISEMLIGQMRLQWWRDRLGEMAEGKVPHQPLAQSVAPLIQRGPLTSADLVRLIDGREHDLTDDAPPSLEALEAYADRTSGELTMLAVKAAGGGEQPAARAIGTAYGLVGLMRAVPFHASQRRSFLPVDLCRTHGLDVGRMFDRGELPELERVVRQVLARATGLLAVGRGEATSIPRAARAPLLIAELAARDIRFLNRNGADPFVTDPKRTALGVLLKLWWGGVSGRV